MSLERELEERVFLHPSSGELIYGKTINNQGDVLYCEQGAWGYPLIYFDKLEQLDSTNIITPTIEESIRLFRQYNLGEFPFEGEAVIGIYYSPENILKAIASIENSGDKIIIMTEYLQRTKFGNYDHLYTTEDTFARGDCLSLDSGFQNRYVLHKFFEAQKIMKQEKDPSQNDNILPLQQI